MSEINLATEKQMVSDLKAELSKVKDPSQVIRVTTEGGVVNITKVESRIRSRTPYSSAVCV